MSKLNFKNKKGFGVVEVMIALGMASIILVSVGNALSSTHKLNRASEMKEKALSFAKQYLEVVTEIKNDEFDCRCSVDDCTSSPGQCLKVADIQTCPLIDGYSSCWTEFPDGLLTNTPLSLFQNMGVWQFSSGAENIVSDPRFDRQISLENIDSDFNRKKVIVEVTWTEGRLEQRYNFINHINRLAKFTMRKLIKNQKGFSLIELLVYISITTVTLLILTSFVVDVTKNAVRTKITKEVQQNARLLISKITQEVRTASNIDGANSVFDSDQGKLTLDKSTGSVSFYWQDDEVYYSEDLNADLLSNNKVRVTKLNFQRNNNAITVNLTVEQKNINARTEGTDKFELSSTIVPRPMLY